MSVEGISDCDVFVSYSSADRQRALAIVQALRKVGMSLWRDGEQILGGESYGTRIVQGIRKSKVLLLLCSNASMRSKNVKQEVQLAWKYDIPYLPLLLETVSFPEQIEYWLEGTQWIDVQDKPESEWLPAVIRSLQSFDLRRACDKDVALTFEAPEQWQTRWQDLWKLARYTDQVWPVPAESAERTSAPRKSRGLGAAQTAVQHGFRLGSRVRLLMELERDGHVLLLDQGPEGIIYCLCPSQFARRTRLAAGQWVFPQPDSSLDSFVVTGRPGREQLLAIVSDNPLPFDWTPSEASEPARILDENDIQLLVNTIRLLPSESWSAYSSYFDVV